MTSGPCLPPARRGHKFQQMARRRFRVGSNAGLHIRVVPLTRERDIASHAGGGFSVLRRVAESVRRHLTRKHFKMADVTTKTYAAEFSCDEFSIGQTVSDGVITASFAVVKIPPKQTFGGIGALVGRADAPNTQRSYYVVLTGIKSQGAELDGNAQSSGGLCRDPIAAKGRTFEELTTGLGSIIDSGTLIPAAPVVFILPALLDAWSRKGYSK